MKCQARQHLQVRRERWRFLRNSFRAIIPAKYDAGGRARLGPYENSRTSGCWRDGRAYRARCEARHGNEKPREFRLRRALFPVDVGVRQRNPDHASRWCRRDSSAPSSHIAGIFSRVEHERGAHKAPANEVIRGALDLERHVAEECSTASIHMASIAFGVSTTRLRSGVPEPSAGNQYSRGAHASEHPLEITQLSGSTKAVTHVTESG